MARATTRSATGSTNPTGKVAMAAGWTAWRGRWGLMGALTLFLAASVVLSNLPAAALLPAAWAAQQGGVRPMLPGDSLLGPARGNAASAIAFANRYGARLPADVSAYIAEVYRLAPQVGLDPAIVVAQSALETDTWRTAYWANHRNPAGIGITFDGQSSFTWATGTDAARGHLVHLSLYVSGRIPAGSPLAPYISLDPRYQAAIDTGYAGIARTIVDLTGRWATDPIYDSKLTGRGNDILYRYRIAAFSGSANSTGAAATDDASAATGWRTTGGTPTTASLTLDLGRTVAIGRLRWLLGAPGVTDRLTIARSTDGASWTPIGVFGSGPTGRWQGISPNASARFIRFTAENPRQQPVLGTISEVQFWPPSSVAWPYHGDSSPVAPVSPSPSASASASASPSVSTSASPSGSASSRPSSPAPSASAPASVGPSPSPSTVRATRTPRPATATPTRRPTATVRPTSTPPPPTVTPSRRATSAPRLRRTLTPVSTATLVPTSVPTAVPPTATATPTSTPVPTSTPTPEPTPVPSGEPSPSG